MNGYKKTIILQWVFIFALLILTFFSFKKSNDLAGQIDSLSSLIEDSKGPTEADSVSSQIAVLDDQISEQRDQISTLSSRMDDAESGIKKNSNKIDDFCLIKNICI
ncbi:hypothetical protein F993_01652 [Acinetobacter proteolyticus]|uniref:Uncharacterized protein n=1 Tax=Acinetobacter proteolyticus TaxID=1776741 RepID=A0ABN0JE38_9GAMM|nr:hypothetical protein [Acinetobacter proteolyticus]ENU23499.1 hypothetical protein F993_01652 [Acinetobacter proteolyticus]